MKKVDLKTNKPYQQTVEHAVEYFSKILTEVIRKIHKEHGFEVSPEEFNVIEAIYLYPGIIQADIAKKTLIRCSYVCKLLTGLEEKGFMRREQKIKGKKQIIFENYLTESGEKVYGKIRAFAINETYKIFKGGKKEADEFIFKLFEAAEYIKELYNIKF